MSIGVVMPETNNVKHEDRIKTLANYAIIILGIVALGAIFQFAAHIFIPITVAYFCMLLLSPVAARTAIHVDKFLFKTKAKFGRFHKSEESQLVTAFSIILVLLAFSIVLFAFFLLLQGQINMIVNEAENIMDNVVNPLKEWLQGAGVLGDADAISTKVEELKNSAIQFIPTAVKPVISVFFTFVFIIFLTIFLMLGKSKIDSKLLDTYHEKSQNLIDVSVSIEKNIRNYLLTKLITSCVTGVSIGLVLLIWLPPGFAFLWGLIYFVMNFIPIYGSMIAGVLAVLYTVAVKTGDPGGIPAYFSIVGIAAVNILVSNALEPKLMQSKLPLGAVNVLVSVIIWGFLWGAWGMFLAVPIALCFKVLIEHVYGKCWLTIFMEA